jgi:hypothetical protein
MIFTQVFWPSTIILQFAGGFFSVKDGLPPKFCAFRLLSVQIINSVKNFPSLLNVAARIVFAYSLLRLNFFHCIQIGTQR